MKWEPLPEDTLETCSLGSCGKKATWIKRGSCCKDARSLRHCPEHHDAYLAEKKRIDGLRKTLYDRSQNP